MKFKLIMAEEFGKAFVPKVLRPKLRKFLIKAGIVEVPYTIFGLLFYIGVILTAVVYITSIYPVLVERNASVPVFMLTTMVLWVGIQMGLSILFMLITYVYLDVKIFNRTKNLELVLQEFLRYVSENLRGGMPFERAMWDAIRPKFGVLAEEIRLTAKKVMTGQDIDEALGD